MITKRTLLYILADIKTDMAEMKKKIDALEKDKKDKRTEAITEKPRRGRPRKEA